MASLVGDRSLRLSFPLDSGTVDQAGLPVVPTPGAGVTTLNMAGQPWAEIEHRPGALADSQHLDDIVAAARLAIDHERFEAQALAQLRLLRESRTRVVSAADHERQRLERDLHDGAQQRLVALAMAIELARLSADGDGIDDSVLEACADHVRGAIDDVRTIAHGIFPSVLAEEGLVSAFAQLAEAAPIRIRIQSPIGRLPSHVESAAYFVGARAVDRFVTDDGVIELSRTTRCLRLRVTVDRAPDLAMTDLEDRAGALDGTLILKAAPNDRPQLVLELPCAS
ncbi:histidine kinase [Pedococcus sp. KACC 23699]|uniref:histidine kinase n=1 Tax=Pedococcus sp. KACC 23699 TaxID=3149228 RepID=A0AAU7JV13_9MICO